MKHLTLFLFLIFCIKINAQKNSLPLKITDPAMDSYLKKHKMALLNIKIIHAPDTISKVRIKCTYVNFGSGFQVPKFYQFNRNGFVKIILDHPLSYQQIWLDIDHYLYAGIYVNDELNITIDAIKIKDNEAFYMIGSGVKYSGKDGELNRIMNTNSLYKKDTKDNLKAYLNELRIARSKYSEDQFLKKCDSVYKIIHSIDNEFINDHPNFKWAIENEWDADYYGSLCVAYWFDKMPDTLFRKINAFSPYFTSNAGVIFYNYFFTYTITKKDNPKINVDDQLNNNYFSYSSDQKAVLDSLKYYSQLPDNEKIDALKAINLKKYELFLNEIQKINVSGILHLIDSFYTPPKSDILKTFLLEKAKNTFAETYPLIIKSMHTSWCRNIARIELIQTNLNQKQIDSLLAKGTQIKGNSLYIGKALESFPFSASLYKLDNLKNVDEFIANLKSKFQNKALIIDFWATWCAPCLKELPISKELHEANKDLPIEYIYICTNSNSNIAIWKNKIAELQLPGTHIFADDKLVSELKIRFNSEESGFPTYIVIDANGKLRPKAIEWMHPLERNQLKSAVGL